MCWQHRTRVALVAGLNPTSHDTSLRQPCTTCLLCPKEVSVKRLSEGCQVLVRFFALLRIKPHAPLLVRVPVYSFEFHTCVRTPQAEHLMRYLRHRNRATPTPSAHRLRRGLPGYLILFAPHAFVPQCQLQSRKSPSPLVFLLISTHFTATLGIPLSSPALKSCSSQGLQ